MEVGCFFWEVGWSEEGRDWVFGGSGGGLGEGLVEVFSIKKHQGFLGLGVFVF
jgi:hypothetical protein